jgi:flagellar protein FlgJ
MADLNNIDPGASLLRAQASSTDRTVAALTSREGKKTCTDADLKDASEQFESLLLNFMIREMRATVPESELLPRSMAEDIFTGMLDEKIAGEMAKSGGIGLSRLIFDQLKPSESE